MASKFLHIFEPLIAIIPQVKKPQSEISFRKKVYFTGLVFFIFVLMASTPIFRSQAGSHEPFAFMRTITATTQGSQAELGIISILTSGLIMGILIGLKIIDVNFEDQKDLFLYNGTIKVLSFLIAIIFSIMLLVGGVYGSPGNFDTFSQLFIIVQLVGSSIILIYLDEMVQKGWGLGSGIAIFIAASIILQIFGSLFSVQPILEGSNDLNLAVTSNRGIVIALIAWATQRGLFEAIQVLFFRYDLTNAINLPDLSILSVIFAFVVFIIVIYLESINIEVPISDEKNNQINCKYSVKLFYFTVIPLILTYTIFTDIYFIAKLVWNISGRENATSLLTNLLGRFKQDVTSQQYVPISGLVYFLTPPRALIGEYGVFNPNNPLPSIIRAIIYSFAIITMCVVFTIILLRVHGVDTHDITYSSFKSETKYKNLKLDEKNMTEMVSDEFQKIIIFGGLVLGIMAAFANFLAPLGSGVSIILVTSIISQYVYVFVLKKSDKLQIIGFYRFKE